MDTGLIEQAINTTFRNLSRPGPKTLIRCERLYQRRPLSVFYFDFSSAPICDEFDIREYQERHIAADYYRHRGFLQWNYYLVFLLEDQALSRLREERLASIQHDTSYARKYVVPVSDLERFIANATTVAAPSVSPTNDVVSLWKARLDDNELSDIHQEGPRTRVLERIRSGAPLRTRTVSTQTDDTPPTPFGRPFAALQIERYRHLAAGTYPLSRVNLLAGPNGTGKTSFLEGIELCVCGATKRSGDERGAKLALVDDAGQRFAKEDTISANRYKAMGNALYAIVGGRGENPMPEGFARFNFFSTDAAYALAHDKTETPAAIRKAIVNLALGGEADRVGERLLIFFDALDKKCRGCRGNVEDAERLAGQLEAKVADLEKDLEQQGGRSMGDLDELRRRAHLKQTPESIETMRQTVSGIEAACKRIVTATEWMESPTRESIHSEFQNLVTVRSAVTAATESTRATSATLARVHEDAARVKEELVLVRQAGELRTIEGIESLKLANEATALRISAANADRAGSALAVLNRIVPSIEGLSGFGAPLDDRIVDVKERLAALNQRIASAEAVAGDVARLLSSLKVAGSEYLSLVEDQNTCPLCGTRHPPGELRALLEKEGDARDEVLVQLKAQAEGLNATSKRFEELRLALTSLAEVAAAVGARPPDWQKPADAVKWAEGLVVGLSESRRALGALDHLASTLKERGGDLDQALRLDTRLSALLGQGILGASTLQLAEAVARRESELASLDERAAQHDRELAGLAKHVEVLLSTAFPGLYETPHMLSVFKERQHAIGDAVEVLRDVERAVDLGSRDLRTVAAELEEVRRELEADITLRAKLAATSSMLEEKRKQVQANQGSLETSRAELARYKKAFDVVADLVDSHSLDRHFAEFIDTYKREILAIFERLQQPHEFEDLLLEADGNQGFVLVRKGGEPAQPHRISTGQRSALALAIFLALNGSARAKLDLILIDDPIAHIDDLNSLAFIDYLRNAAMAGTQIFIATANTKLQSLLKMKFSFLGGEGFQVLEFPVAVR